MRILSVGTFNKISNTCLHRHWGLEKLGDVDRVNMYDKPITLWYKIANRLFNYGLPISLPDIANCNQQIKELVQTCKYDLVWIDKGLLVNKTTLEYIKHVSPTTKIVSYSPDNMALRHNQSQNYLECIPLYDYLFTNKSYILENMRRLGAKHIEFVNNSYEASFHYPRELTENDYKRLGGDVGFIGAWEQERCDSILYLADRGISVKVFGDGKWRVYDDYSPNLEIRPGVFSEDYSKALQAFKISLCFLRKMNFDQQTTRSVEIPACGGFMLAERTDEHLALFEEGTEAAYFSSNQELLEQCKYYLAHEGERKAIAEAGQKRCETSGYSNEAVVRKIVKTIFSI